MKNIWVAINPINDDIFLLESRSILIESIKLTWSNTERPIIEEQPGKVIVSNKAGRILLIATLKRIENIVTHF
jgi:hypothetical protein